MITKFLTEVTVKFNPFSARSRSARLFLVNLPPNVRSGGTAVNTKVLPRDSQEPASLAVKFSDGKEMKFNCEELSIKSLIEEVDRHSRALQKAANLADQ